MNHKAIGALTAAAMPPTDDHLVPNSAASQTAAKMHPAGQWSAVTTPIIVATPLPPAKRSQTG